MKILHLNLKAEYFNAIKDGTKEFEFRLFNDYWNKRLVKRDYDEVHFKLGYPKNDDNDKIIKCKYAGYEIRSIKHTHFCNDSYTKVFAIKIKKEVING